MLTKVPFMSFVSKTNTIEGLVYAMVDNSTHSKPITTGMKKWSGVYYQEKDPIRHIVDNTPRKGFSIVELKQRSMTSNIVFRVRDPSGFVLEVYQDCMQHLLLNSTIVHGCVQEECLWYKDGQNWFLCVVGSDEYKEEQLSIKPVVVRCGKFKDAFKDNDRLTIVRSWVEESVVYLGFIDTHTIDMVDDVDYKKHFHMFNNKKQHIFRNRAGALVTYDKVNLLVNHGTDTSVHIEDNINHDVVGTFVGKIGDVEFIDVSDNVRNVGLKDFIVKLDHTSMILKIHEKQQSYLVFVYGTYCRIYVYTDDGDDKFYVSKYMSGVVSDDEFKDIEKVEMLVRK